MQRTAATGRTVNRQPWGVTVTVSVIVNKFLLDPRPFAPRPFELITQSAPNHRWVMSRTSESPD